MIMKLGAPLLMAYGIAVLFFHKFPSDKGGGEY
jgi:hypothetical protein